MTEQFNKESMRDEIIYAFETALSDTKPPKLTGVVVDWDDRVISGLFIYLGDITPIDLEFVSDLEGEVISHFNNHMIDLIAVRADAVSDSPLLSQGTWVYRRSD